MLIQKICEGSSYNFRLEQLISCLINDDTNVFQMCVVLTFMAESLSRGKTKPGH